MSATAMICPFCQAEMGDEEESCPACQVSAAWADRQRAADFCVNVFEHWRATGVLRPPQLDAIKDVYRQVKEQNAQAARQQAPPPAEDGSGLPAQGACWSCEKAGVGHALFCPGCGVPLGGTLARTCRFLGYLHAEVQKHQEAGRIELAQLHACQAEVEARRAALTRQMFREKRERKRLEPAVAPESKRPAAAKAGRPQRPLMEVLLDPRSIQWLLALGGALLVVGLVIWLATLGVFESKVVIAGAMGAANAVLLLGGWFLIRATRYQTAGRAITLLACLVMPLNLWFYHAQGLEPLVLHQQLWIAALVCCALYAASAWMLQDSMFVYVLVAGVTLTGLLFLADMGRLQEIAAPATMLVAMGLVSIHLERAFLPGEGPFSRKGFGLAFFWSGHGVLAAGLLLLLGAQLAGDWLYQPVFKSFYGSAGLAQPVIVTEAWARWLAIFLVLAGTYAYVYSDLVVRRLGVYISLAAFTLLWAEFLVIRQLELQPAAVVTVLAATGLAVNLLASQAAAEPLLRRNLPTLGMLLSFAAFLFGVLLHVRGTSTGYATWRYSISWGFVGAMAATAASCRMSAFLLRQQDPRHVRAYFAMTAAATLLAAAGCLHLLNLTRWQDQAPILMLIPIAYLVASQLYGERSPARPLALVAHLSTAAMLVWSLSAAFQGFLMVRGQPLNLALSAFFALAALFYVLAAWFRKEGREGWAVYLATLMASAALWQLLAYLEVGEMTYILTFAVAGFLLLSAYRLALVEQLNFRNLAAPAFQAGNALLTLGLAAGALFTLTQLAAGAQELQFRLLLMLAALAFLAAMASGIVRQPAWRRWYLAALVGESILAVLTLAVLGNLTIWQKAEVASVATGLVVLIAGHVGWRREQRQDQHLDLVTFSLFLGCLLVGLPVTVAVLYYRSTLAYTTFGAMNEAAMLVLGMLLLATGFVFQLRSTTLTGAAMLTVYVLSLVLFLNAIERIQTAAIWMTVGGAALFGSGLLLSLYRDRLLQLPDKIRRREGVFTVLNWR